MKFLVDSVTEDLKRSMARECGKLAVGAMFGILGKVVTTASPMKLLHPVIREYRINDRNPRLRTRVNDYIEENTISLSSRDTITAVDKAISVIKEPLSVSNRNVAFSSNIFTLPSGAKCLLIKKYSERAGGGVLTTESIYVRPAHEKEFLNTIKDLYLKPMKTAHFSFLRSWENKSSLSNASETGRWVSRPAYIPHLKDIPFHPDALSEISEVINTMKSHWDQMTLEEQEFSMTVVFDGDYGSGKTYTAAAISRELEARLRLFPTEVSVSDFWTAADVIQRSVWLADEADKNPAFTDDYTNAAVTLTSSFSGKVTSREVLNATTGPQAIKAGLIILVCNDKTKLREGLLREGRGGTTITFKPVDDAGLKYFFKNKFDYDVPEGIEFADIKVCDYFKYEQTNGYEPARIVEALPKKR